MSELDLEIPSEQLTSRKLVCYHCGLSCISDSIAIDEKVFCCEGCKLVYELLNDKGLCDYYKLQSHPGLSQIKAVRKDKYSFLDNEEIARRLYSFTDGKSVIVKFYLPGIHCSSCMWLIEHLSRLNDGILESRLNFSAKEVTIRFLTEKISIRQVAELLTTIGYEPHISLEDTEDKKIKHYDRKKIYKLGIAGFCFGNIMMMSFPEYFAFDSGAEHHYMYLFRWLNLFLSVPVFFYSGSEFFVSAWKGFRQKMLNIDAPIAFALVITYTRSIYEILTNTGSGYLDSMSGIVFFMLVGRVVQERAYQSITFHRDYKSYFPVAVNTMVDGKLVSKSLKDLKEKDLIQLSNDEIIPADSILVAGSANVDYSFVTGESDLMPVSTGGMIYAGGKQVGMTITLQVVKPVAGSYLTSLWNHNAFNRNKTKENKDNSVIHVLSRYFTYILFTLTAVTALYWAVTDPSKIWPSISAMLIVACPCALLLSATFTNGNILRLLSNNGLFLRDASVIEQLGKINHIVFDKTGTLTHGMGEFATYGHQMTDEEKSWIRSVTASSNHPYSKALTTFLGGGTTSPVQEWKELPGLGIEATVQGNHIKVGSAAFAGANLLRENEDNALYVRINDQITAFVATPQFRESVTEMMPSLLHSYKISLLSGDNDRQAKDMRALLGSDSELLFSQKPADKLHYIGQLQLQNRKVLMLGDGLNDAGALQQSDVGITLTSDVNNFVPSCDAILDARSLHRFPQILRLAKAAQRIIAACFIVSILYNFIGLGIAATGNMSPVIAAILMPASTLSIVLVSTGVSSILARMWGLSLSSPKDELS